MTQYYFSVENKKVGELYQEDVKRSQEEVRFNFGRREGVLIIKTESPTKKEIREIMTGRFKVALKQMGDFIFLFFKFGWQEWMDTPFSPHLKSDKNSIPDLVENGVGYFLQVILVNAETGLIVAKRIVELPTDISRKFREGYIDLACKAFDANVAKLNLDNIYQTYTTNQLVQLSQEIE